MLATRDHPFNRSTRPLLEQHAGEHDPYHLYRQQQRQPQHKPPAVRLAKVSAPAPATAQMQPIMRGFHDFTYVPKAQFCAGYPYGGSASPPHRRPSSAAADDDDYDQLADASTSEDTLDTHPYTSAFSDDSGVLATSTGSSQSSHVSRHRRSSPPSVRRPPPPPPAKRYYDPYEDDDGYAGSPSNVWRPYGPAPGSIAAAKGPFLFGTGAPRVPEPTQPLAADGPVPVRRIKCVVVGDAAVGKTNLICSYLENRFVGEHIPTASDMFDFEVNVNEAPVRVTLCDTAGQDTLDALRQLSYPDSDIFVLCFSVVRPETFRSLQRKWLPQFRRRSPGALVLLVGTQADLRTDPAVLGTLQRRGEAPVPLADAFALAQAAGAQYVETSSRYRIGVKDAFDAAIWQALVADHRLTKAKRQRRPLWRRLLCLA